MAPQFCSVCGNILDISNEATVNCDVCGEINQNTTRSETTTSSTNHFPSALRNKLTSKTQAVTLKDRQNTRVITKSCPECHAVEVTWSEAQLRGADEGSTIFYRCPTCAHRWQEAN